MFVVHIDLSSLAVTDTLKPGDVLTDALTVEGLLFVAFSFAFTLAQPVQGGRHPFFAKGWFGWLVVAAIAGVATSAGIAWWSLYHPWPLDIGVRIQALGLALGIVVQPVFAAIINWEAK